jgi:hypothetical protein
MSKKRFIKDVVEVRGDGKWQSIDSLVASLRSTVSELPEGFVIEGLSVENRGTYDYEDYENYQLCLTVIRPLNPVEVADERRAALRQEKYEREQLEKLKAKYENTKALK